MGAAVTPLVIAEGSVGACNLSGLCPVEARRCGLWRQMSLQLGTIHGD
jgi:hypothetical protein